MMQRLVTVCLLVAVAAGCSFERKWNAMAAKDKSTDALAGRWSGAWQSEPSGHDGTLRAIIEQTGEHEYSAYFKATYAVLFTFKQKIPLTAQREGDRITFQGEADLGAPWGKYAHDGYVEGDTYFSRYTSANDHGTFTMQRVTDAPDATEPSE